VALSSPPSTVPHRSLRRLRRAPVEEPAQLDLVSFSQRVWSGPASADDRGGAPHLFAVTRVRRSTIRVARPCVPTLICASGPQAGETGTARRERPVHRIGGARHRDEQKHPEDPRPAVSLPWMHRLSTRLHSCGPAVAELPRATGRATTDHSVARSVDPDAPGDLVSHDCFLRTRWKESETENSSLSDGLMMGTTAYRVT
jgi:hypothetical protein